MPQHTETQAPHQEIRKESIFERLPYDVRLLIYENLEPGDMPPFSQGFQRSTSGFFLSCRRAKQDFEDLASICLSKYLDKFKYEFMSSTKLNVEFATTLDTPLRHITVTIPFTSLESFHPGSEKAIWKREVLVGLHSLLSFYFDLVRIHFSGTENQPRPESKLDRGKMEVSMHSLLRDVMYMIERVNKKNPGEDRCIRRLVSVTSIFKHVPGRREDAYPDASVNASRICLSWDLREKNSAAEKITDMLNGKMYRDQMQDTDAAGREASFFYHLRDEQRLAGEMGVVSSSRWKLRDDPRVNALLNCVDTRVQYCSSGGLGAELNEVLKGITEREFEECEEEIGRLIYA